METHLHLPSTDVDRQLDSPVGDIGRSIAVPELVRLCLKFFNVEAMSPKSTFMSSQRLLADDSSPAPRVDNSKSSGVDKMT